jgi:hypothetical protein
MSAPMSGRTAAPSVAELPTGAGGAPQPVLEELLRQHEARQALAARAAYSLLRITAAVPPESRFVVEASGAGQRATAWLAGSATNPGRWASRSVLATELAELDVLLVEVQEQLSVVLAWVSKNIGIQVGRGGLQQTVRVPRTLISECTTLISDLATLAPAAAA